MANTRGLGSRLLLTMVSALVCLSCGGSSGSAPTSPSNVLAPYQLVQDGGSRWDAAAGGCTGDQLERLGCFFRTSIKNIGTGCASGTAVTVRFSNEAGQQMGADHQMALRPYGSPANLRSRLIRPGEIVPISTWDWVAPSVVQTPGTFKLYITANSVPC
jgi:hypothetical protein